MIKQNKEQTKGKVEIYCKNPKCFNQYLATHKIRAIKDWQLSDYAWSKSQWKMIKKFARKLKETMDEREGAFVLTTTVFKNIDKIIGSIK